MFFCDFFWSGASLSGTTGVECQKLRVFCDFGARICPEDYPKDLFCYIRPFFQEAKNEQKSPKNVKNWGFLAFFFGRVHPSQGKRGSSVKT